MEDRIQHQFTLRAPTFEKSANWIADPGLLKTFVAACKAPPDSRLLDVCCGTGIVGGAFRGRLSRLEGLDVTEAMLELARQKLDTCHQGSVYKLPFASDTFDVVVCREAWHLLEDPPLAVREMARVLRPGGQLIYGHIVPDGAGDTAWMREIFTAKQPLATGFLTQEDLTALMTQAGLGGIAAFDYHLWEPIDLWIDTHETPPPVRDKIRALYRNVPPEAAAIHASEIAADGSIRDRWRWVVLSGTKPARKGERR